MPSAGRFAARLNALPRDQLVDVLAHLMAHMCEELPNVRQHADAVLADHVPLLTQQAIDGVLLSPDLLPRVFAALELADCAAALVCKAWALEWTSLIAHRRILHWVPLVAPPVRDWIQEAGEFFDPVQLAALPGDRLAIMHGERDIFIVDKQMHLQHEMPQVEWLQCLAAGDNGLYVGLCNASPLLIRYHPDTFAVAAETDAPYRAIAELAIASSGELFALAWNDDRPSSLLALDPLTLAVRFTVSGEVADGALGGDGTFDRYAGGHCSGLAVCSEEVFVGIREERSIRVLSTLAGQLLHVIHSPLPGPNSWTDPRALCCVADRLYLIDAERRIFVLSPDGSVLRVCSAPLPEVGAVAEAAADPMNADPDIAVCSGWGGTCCFDGKLLVCEVYTYPHPDRQIDGTLLAFEGV